MHRIEHLDEIRTRGLRSGMRVMWHEESGCRYGLVQDTSGSVVRVVEDGGRLRRIPGALLIRAVWSP